MARDERDEDGHEYPRDEGRWTRILRYFSFLTVMSDGQGCSANKKENRTYRLRGNGKVDCLTVPTTFAEQDRILPVYDRFPITDLRVIIPVIQRIPDV